MIEENEEKHFNFGRKVVCVIERNSSRSSPLYTLLRPPEKYQLLKIFNNRMYVNFNINDYTYDLLNFNDYFIGIN